MNEIFNTLRDKFPFLSLIRKGDLEYVHWTWGDGDSLDRERVRDIILEQPQFSWSH